MCGPRPCLLPWVINFLFSFLLHFLQSHLGMLQTKFNLFLLYNEKVKGNDVQKTEKKVLIL